MENRFNRYNSVVETVAAHAHDHPEQPCIAELNQICTYGELWAQIVRNAAYLQARGIRKGDRVLLHTSQTIWHAAALLGIHLAGAVAVSVEKNIAPSRLEEITEQVEARFLMTPRKLETKLEQIIPEDLEAFSGEKDYQIVFPRGNEICDILFTTGTTGKSKGVMRTYHNEMASAESIVDYGELDENERALVPYPLNHSGGIGRLYACLISGALMIPTDGVVFLQVFYSLIDKYGVTVIFMGASHLHILLNRSEDRLASYNGKLRMMTIGSSYLDEATRQYLLKLMPEVRLFITYGATESSGACSYEFSKYPDRPHCIGRPGCNTRILITDENGVEKTDASASNPGFITHDGPTVVPGYWNEPELTASVIHNGRLVTRDLGYIDEEGFVYIFGRADDVIITGGNKIAPFEVEDVVMELPEITECACIPVEDPLLGAAPKLYVVMQPGCELDTGKIIRHMQGRLEQFKVPKMIEQIDEIPKTSGSNKINRKALIAYDREKTGTDSSK